MEHPIQTDNLRVPIKFTQIFGDDELYPFCLLN